MNLPLRPAIAGAVTGAVALFGAAPVAGQVPDPLTVHVSLPFAGIDGGFVEDVARGADLALEDAGGRAGSYSVRLAVHDSGDPDTGYWSADATADNARRAASDPSAVAYLGEFNSGASAVSMPILNEAGILQISPTNTYTGLTRREGACCDQPDGFFPTGRRHYARVSAADHLQASALVDYLRRRGVRRVALVHDGDVYGRGLIRMLARRLPSHGAHAVTVVLRSLGDEPRAIARRIARRRADALVFGGTTANGAVPLWRAVHRRNPRLKLFGGDGIADAAFPRRIPRGAARRTRVTTMVLAPWAYPPSAARVLSTLKGRYDRDASPYSLYGHEAMRLILDAVAQAGRHPDVAALRAAAIQQVFATRDRPSPLGRYSIDGLGDVTRSRFGGWRIRRGELVWDRALRADG